MVPATTAVPDANGRVKRSDITQSQTWTRFETALDNDAHVDLGYHYDPVDIIVEPVYASQEADLHVSGTGTTLWINPGVVVAFSTNVTAGGENVSNYSRLSVVGGATIDAQGNGPQPICFTSCAASGDQIGHPNNDWQGRYIWYDTAIHLDVAGPNTRIRYCQFQFMGYGIVVEAWPYSAALDINNCRFGFGDIGIAANSTVLGKTGVKVRNSLLHRLASAGVETFSPALNSEVLVENCTFDQGTKGVYAYSAQTTIRNCIFANTGYGIFVQFGNALKAENHNCFYQSSILFEPDPSDIWQVDPQFDPGSPPVSDINERYYLKQRGSPCFDAGSTSALTVRLADYTTWRTGSADRGPVDIGYHYGPVCGGGDTDGDGMQIGYGMDDNWEIFHFGSIAARNGTEDDDGDGMNTKDEYMFKSNPRVGDIPVRLYRNDAYTSPIADWDEWPGHNRQSPRFVFSSQDPIYIEVVGIQNYWWVQEVFTNEIKVTSEADPANPVYVTLTETGQDTNVFRSTNEPLYLSTQTIVTHLPTGGHKLKVVDEDTLTFSFQTITSGVTRQVVVDRGEAAGCGTQFPFGHPDQGGYWVFSDPKQDYYSCRMTLWDGATTQCHWFPSGDGLFPHDIGSSTEVPNPMARFIKNAGEPTSFPHSLEADFLYIQATHGGPSGTLYDAHWNPPQKPWGDPIFNPTVGMNALDQQSDWNNDVEWVMIYDCSMLTNDGTVEGGQGYKKWRWGLRGIPKRAHGLLGGDASMYVSTENIRDFWEYVNPHGPWHQTFVEAYHHAMDNIHPGMEHSQWWACYYRYDARNDKLDEVAPDNDEQEPWYVFNDYYPTSFTEHGDLISGLADGTSTEKKQLTHEELLSMRPPAASLPRSLIARRSFPSLSNDLPVRGKTRVSLWGNVVHIGKWAVNGQLCTYTPDEAEAAVEAFVAKELPTLSGRVKWYPPSRIRWGIHRADDPLTLQTAGYSIHGQLTYMGIPLLHDTINVTILGETVEFVSLSCHEIAMTATEATGLESCGATLRKALPDITAALSINESCPIARARLVYMGPLDPRSPRATEDMRQYHLTWAVTFGIPPDAKSGGGKIVFVDAVSGQYCGHIPVPGAPRR